MAKDTDRNSDGTFKSIEKASESDAGGEDTATEREIDDMTIHGDGEDQDQFIESFDKSGLSESEGGSRIEQMLRAAEAEPDEVPEGVDPEAVEAARSTLEEEGSIEAAQEALEQNLKQSEAEQAEAEAAEGPEPVPFEHLAQDLGFEDPQQAADAVEVTITVDGEQETVPISELAESGMRQADYTRKTQQLSEERSEVQQAKEAYAQQLEMLATTIGRNFSPQQQQALVQEYNRVVSEISKNTTPDPESVQQEQEQLRQTFDWEGDSEWQEARSNIREYAHDLGFSDQDLASVTDHRLLSILEKSRRYDQLAESTEGLEDERGPSKTLKPGVDRRTQESVERTRQRRRGEKARRGHSKPALKMGSSDSVDDAADKIAGILADEGS